MAHDAESPASAHSSDSLSVPGVKMGPQIYAEPKGVRSKVDYDSL